MYKEVKNLVDYKNIIFDLGGVILNLDYNKTVEEFKRHIPDLDESVFFGKEHQLSFFSKYEIGQISTEVFKKDFLENYKIKMTDEEFKYCWNAMIYDFPIERIVLIERLRGLGKKVYLLSNINELHEYAVENSFSRLKLATSFRDLFNKLYYSHRIGLRKPKQDIFEFVLRDSSLVKEETLFIDDSQHHVIGARKAGIDSIHLQKPQVLEDLGIFKF